MKKIRMLFSFYSKNVFAVCLLFLLMTFSLFFVSNAIGQYRYVVYTKTMFQNSGLNNAVYYMPLSDSDYTSGPDIMNKKIATSTKAVAEFSAVENVLTVNIGMAGYGNRSCSYLLYNKSLNHAFPLNLSEGKWFSDDSFDKADSNKRYNVIVGGALYNHVHVNSDIPITLNNNTTLTVHVIGKLSFPTCIPDFGTGGNTISANDFLAPADMVIFQETPQLTAFLHEKSAYSPSSSMFVQFSPKASKQQKNECLDYMQKNGMYSDYNEIMKNTDVIVQNTLARQMPMPLFFLFVATISLISVSVLMVYKKMQEHSIYYLCGCSRKKSFLYMAFGIGLIALLAGALNMLFIANYQFFASRGILDLGKVIIDRYSILYIAGYIAAVILLSILLPFLVFRKESPIELYRRKDQ